MLSEELDVSKKPEEPEPQTGEQQVALACELVEAAGGLNEVLVQELQNDGRMYFGRSQREGQRMIVVSNNGHFDSQISVDFGVLRNIHRTFLDPWR